MPCKQNRDEVSCPPCRALYVHVPFCAAKCRYCDFYSVRLDAAAAKRFVQAASAELRRQGARLERPLASVFLGGGTPTVLGPELLGELLAACRQWTDANTEFSVEANPGTLDGQIAETLRSAGVNRVNLGVQSFRDDELRVLGRIHSAAAARRAVEALRAIGIENVGIDLIYGIPGQTSLSWSDSVGAALALAPPHLSCYALSFEEGTPLKADLRAGLVSEMAEEAQEACYRHAIDAAGTRGLEHYEISNFARPGRRCRHNLTYWRNEPYLGIGPGATSYLSALRRTNVPDVGAYVEAVLAGRDAPSTQEHLVGRPAMGETVMLGLRLIEGLDRRAFTGRYGRDVLEVFPRSIARYAEMGLMVVTATHVRLSSQALFVADTILSGILSEA